MMLDRISSFVTYFVIGFNVIFAILGIIVLAMGLEFIALKDYDSPGKTNFGFYGVITIITGVSLFIIAIFGCYGAILKNYCLIYTFCVLLSIIMALNLIIIVKWMICMDKVKMADIKEDFKYGLNQYNRSKEIRIFWDTLQESLECCGLDNYTDWDKNIPNSCCKKQLEGGEKCPENDIFKKGCWEIQATLISRELKIISIVSIMAFLVLISDNVCACALAFAIQKRKKNSDTNKEQEK